MHVTRLKIKALVCWLSLAVLLPLSAFGGLPGGFEDSASSGIISRYLQATQSHDSLLRGAQMEVAINASVPKLKEHGTLRALRKISKVGQITYRVLAFQGDSAVKNQVIARYLQAEQQGQGDLDLALTPRNYKFKYKGVTRAQNADAYVFQLSPRKKRVGLWKGELWLDARSYLPVLEKGKLVKNPSIFFKQVNFERGFSIQDGQSLPSYINSTIDTRLIGKVELTINFSKFEKDTTEAGVGQAAVLASYNPN